MKFSSHRNYLKRNRTTSAFLGIALCVMLTSNLLAGCNLLTLMNPTTAPSSQALLGEVLPLPDSSPGITILAPQNGINLHAGSKVSLQVLIEGAKAPLTVELWHNGQLLGARQFSIEEYQPLFTIDWIMEEQATTIVLVVTDAANAQAVSNALTLVPSDVAAVNLQVAAVEGDTRQSLSESYGVPLDAVLPEALPDYDSAAPLPIGSVVSIKMGEFDPQEALPALPVGFSAPFDLEDTALQPGISGYIQDGKTNLTVNDPAGIATSLLLYRADSQSGIFRLIGQQKVTSGKGELTFTDEAAGNGFLTYYVVAVTPEGNRRGNFLQIENTTTIDSAAITQTSFIVTDDGRLKIFDGVGIVYFYAAINHAQARRVPETGFIHVSDGFVDVNSALATLTQSSVFPLWLDMEVWTWTGTTAQKLGEVHTWIERTTLAVCVDKAGRRCGGVGTGEFHSRELTEGNANTDVDEGTILSFPWKTSLKGNPRALVQVSLAPFTSSFDTDPQGLVYTAFIDGACTDQGCGSVFTIEFANLLQGGQTGPVMFNQQQTFEVEASEPPALAVSGIRRDLIKSFQDAEILELLAMAEYSPGAISAENFQLLPVDFYVRVTPVSNTQPSGSPSNIVLIHYGPFGSSTSVTYVPTVAPPPQPDQVYDAKIIEFTPPIPPSLGWGCVYITAVEPLTYNESLFRELMEEHIPYCPGVYKGQGEESWYESFWNFATSVVNWISEQYAAIKAAVIANIAGALDGLGICSNCEAYIALALDAGLVALGIPPSLPDMSKLTDMGVDYLVQQVAQSIGVPCDETCMEIIRAGVDEMADQTNTQVVSTYQDTEEAHRHGREPLFVPPGVTVEPAKESGWQVASLRVAVTRKPGSGNITMQQLEQIESTLYMTFDGYNDVTGQSYIVYNCWSGGCDLVNPSPDCTAVAVPGCPESRSVTQPLEGALFESIVLTIGSEVLPHLQPGETRELNLALLPALFWIPGHEQDTTYSWYDDWGYLYEGGKGFVSLDVAARSCLENISGHPPSYSYTLERTDYWEIDLPDTSTWGFNQVWTAK